MSERHCSFASQALPERLPATGNLTSPHDRSISPSDNHSQGDVALPDVSPPSAASRSNTDSPGRPSINSHQDQTLDEAINPKHMELLIHLLHNKEMFNLGDRVSDHFSGISRALQIGLKSLYLLYQLLAFSARHLAFLHPGNSTSYLHQADTLQTRAISLFNAAWTGVDESNCVAVLLFSAILGHHIFADTLAKRDPGGLESFITHYTQCIEMHRGIHTIAKTSWPLLMDTELEQMLLGSAKFTSQPPRGNQCQRVKELVDSAEGMGEEDKEACRRAIQYLQVGFDAVLADEEEDELSNKYQMIFSWTMLAPPEFTGLLVAKRPEVLVLLAYYALLLHYGRSKWQVGDAGVYILGIVVDYLGPQWDHWLEYPREMIARDLE